MRRKASLHIEFDDHIDLTPMLDCVFVLLLFLIIATTFEDDGLFKVTLPKAAEPQVRTVQQATTLLIAKTGEYAIGRELIPEGKLLPTLQAMRREGRLQALVIKGDAGCPYAKVVYAFDVAQAIGVSEYGFVVEKSNP